MSSSLRAAIIAAVAAVVANIIVYVIVISLLKLDVRFAFPPGSEVQPLELIMVILSSAVGAIGAVAVFEGLKRFAANPRQTFIIVAVVVWLLSLGAPVSLNASGTTTVVLMLMHTVAAVVIVWALLRFNNK